MSTTNQYLATPWIKQLPQNWEVKKMKHVMSFFTGATPDSGKRDYYSESGNNWITITDLNGKYTNESTNKITDIAVKDKNMKVAPKGALLYSFKLSVGQVAFVSEDTYTNEAIACFSPQEGVDLGFWYYALQSYFIWNANENIYGAKIFNEFLIKNSWIIYPPLQTQKTIAEYLNQKDQKIKKFIENKRKMIDLLKEEMLALATKEQFEGKGDFIRIRHLVTLINREVKIEDDKEYIALGLYNRGRGLFHKPSTKGVDMGDSTFFYVKEGDLILSGQFAWEGAVTMASASENGCVVSHRYPVLVGKTIKTEYLLALLMTDFGDFLLNDSSRGAAGRNRPLNINLLLSKKSEYLMRKFKMK